MNAAATLPAGRVVGWYVGNEPAPARTPPPPKFSLFMAVIVVGIAVAVVVVGPAVIKPVACQDHLHLNTPPTLFVPERNWRIPETERVGTIIARIRADDPESDELIFGLESQFRDNMPFYIDPVGGVVYLNESLSGRGGENFFLYITVTDGQLTAKNEVYVNILSANMKKNQKQMPTPSITNVVNNITQFLPAFAHLPAVQSIRNQYPNRRPSNILPPGFNVNGVYPSSVYNYHPSQQRPQWSTNNNNNNLYNVVDNSVDTDQVPDLTMTTETTKAATGKETTSRTKLTPIKHNNGLAAAPSSSSSSISTSTVFDILHVNSTKTMSGYDTIHTNAIDAAYNVNDGLAMGTVTSITPTLLHGFKSQILPVILVVGFIFATAILIVTVLCRKRLCAIGKTLKTKSKEEMAKKSQQSNRSSSNMTDDTSHNSMVLQHWHGPTAFGNRYVPWERDPQPSQQFSGIATSQLSTSAISSGIATNINQSSVTSAMTGVTATNTPFLTGNMQVMARNIISPTAEKKNHHHWEFPRHRLKFFNILGEGAFGQVWRCEATDIDGQEGITTVAVKTLKENASEVEKKDLLSELEVMKSLEPHINVVRFLGCCTDKDPIFVIIEYVNRGKLQTYLRRSRAERHYGNTHGKSNILTSGDLTSFMYQVAKGMEYLTSRGIIHRDLAARNILISDDHTCKVADFGFARDVVTSKIYERKSEGKLPIRWMAIESLYDNIFSTKSDIWSFGILMWEIVTLGSTPYPGISASDVMRKVRDGYRLEKPEHCRRELYNIMYYCWSEDANERPTFTEVVQMLDKLLHTEMDYIELERFPDHNYYNIVHLSGEKV